MHRRLWRPAFIGLLLCFFPIQSCIGNNSKLEPFISNPRSTRSGIVYNTRLQVLYTKKAPHLISLIAAHKRELVGPALVVVDGIEFHNEALTAEEGKVKVGEQEYQVSGSVEPSRRAATIQLTCKPSAPLTYRLPLKQEAYRGQGYGIAQLTGRLVPGPAGMLARAEEVGEVVVGSLSKRRLTFKLGDSLSGLLRRDAQGEFWLELTSQTGVINFSLSAPYEAVGIALATDHFHNVYDFAERGEIAITVTFSNNTERTRWINYTAEMTDFAGRKLFEQRSAVRLAAHDSAQCVLKPDISRLGFYKLVINAKDSITGETFRNFITLGVIEPVERPKPPDASGKFGQTFLNDVLQRARFFSRCGITWSRDNIGWAAMEPTRGAYAWSRTDRFTDNAMTVGLGLLIINGGRAPWAQLDETVKDKWGEWKRVDLEGWKQWWSEMARRYKGKVGAWEVMNEIDGNGAPIEMAVELHRTAYEAIKEQDPDTLVVANVANFGKNFDYLKQFLEAGGNKGCDVIGGHPYPPPGASPEQWGMREIGENVRTLIAPYFDNPRLWWTEYGILGDDELAPYIPGPEGRDLASLTMSERKMAQSVVRAYLAGMAAGVERMFYFLPGDSRIEPFPWGWLREEGIRPALCAINTMCRTLEYTDFVQDVKLQANVQLMVFQGKEHSAAAVWCVGMPERDYVLHAPLAPEDVEVLDFMGNALSFLKGSQELSIPFDGCPTYIISWKLPAEALAEALGKAGIEGAAGLPPAGNGLGG